MYTFWFEWNRDFGVWRLQCVESEVKTALFLDTRVSITPGSGAARGVTPTAGSKVGAISRVVSSLANNDRVLTGFEHTRAIRVVPEGSLELG